MYKYIIARCVIDRYHTAVCFMYIYIAKLLCVYRFLLKCAQACFDGAEAMNARGAGVQLRRAECFTHACRALWPGNDEMDPCVVQAFSL